MVGVPGTLKGRINNARWTVSHNDGQEGETNVSVITDENVNYRWFIDLGPSNAETELIARLIAQAPYMLDVLMELVERFDKGTIRMDYLRRVLDDAKGLLTFGGMLVEVPMKESGWRANDKVFMRVEHSCPS